MNKKQMRELVLDIGHLIHINTKNGDVDISKVMDDLNKTESYKPFQKVIKDAKEYQKIHKRNKI